MEKKELIFRGVDAENPYSWTKLQKYGKIAYIDSNSEGVTGKENPSSIVNNMIYKNIMESIDLYADMDELVLEKYCAVILPAMSNPPRT